MDRVWVQHASHQEKTFYTHKLISFRNQWLWFLLLFSYTPFSPLFPLTPPPPSLNLLFLPYFFSSSPTSLFSLLLNQNSMPMAPTTSTMSHSTTVTASWRMWTMSGIWTLTTTYKTHCSLVFALFHRFHLMANLPKRVNLNASIDGFDC